MSTPTTLKITRTAASLPDGHASEAVTTLESRNAAIQKIVDTLAAQGYRTSFAAIRQAFHRAPTIIRAGIKFEVFDVSESAEIKIAPIIRATVNNRLTPHALQKLKWLGNQIKKHEALLADAREKCMIGTEQGYADAKIKALVAEAEEIHAILGAFRAVRAAELARLGLNAAHK